MSEEYGTVKISNDILEKIKESIKGTEFKSVEEYITFVLEDVIKDEHEEPEEVFSEEDEKKEKERLRALGYLD